MFTVNNKRHKTIVYCKNVQTIACDSLSEFVGICRTYKIVALKSTPISSLLSYGFTDGNYGLHMQPTVPTAATGLRLSPAAAGRRLKKKRISYYLWSCGLRPKTPCNRENAVYLHAVLQVINSASPLRTSSAGFQMEPVKTIDEAGLLLPIRTEKTLCLGSSTPAHVLCLGGRITQTKIYPGSSSPGIQIGWHA